MCGREEGGELATALINAIIAIVGQRREVVCIVATTILPCLMEKWLPR